MNKKAYVGILERIEMVSTYKFGEAEEMQRLKYESPSLQAAKARITRAANLQKFGTDWDGVSLLGKSERWENWRKGLDFQQKDGTWISCCYRMSNTVLWHFDEDKELTKYKLQARLYWKKEKDASLPNEV